MLSKYIGIPYKELNCIQFVWKAYKEIFGKPMRLFFNPKDFKDNLEDRLKLFKEHQKLAKYLDKPKDYCLVFMGFNHDKIYHIGFYYQGYIYHSEEDFGVKCEKLDKVKKRFKIMEFVEYETDSN